MARSCAAVSRDIHHMLRVTLACNPVVLTHCCRACVGAAVFTWHFTCMCRGVLTGYQHICFSGSGSVQVEHWSSREELLSGMTMACCAACCAADITHTCSMSLTPQKTQHGVVVHYSESQKDQMAYSHEDCCASLAHTGQQRHPFGKSAHRCWVYSAYRTGTRLVLFAPYNSKVTSSKHWFCPNPTVMYPLCV